MKDSPEPLPQDVPKRAGRVLIVGARRRLRRLAAVLDQGPWSGLEVVGYVDRSGRGRQLAIHPAAAPVPVLGPLTRLGELLRRSQPTHVLVALSERPGRRTLADLERLEASSVQVHWVGDEAPPVPPHRRFRPTASAPTSLRLGRLAKRGLDIGAATLGLLLLSPLLVAVSTLILLTSGWPILYTQERIGQNGRTFRILKFRSMKRNAEGRTGPIWAANHDDRCTPIGNWLRNSSIDELPQLINILKGDMSLVGPRPERPMFVERFSEDVPDYPLRHTVPVGLTGWAQVHGWRGRTSIRKRLQYDLDYIRRWSFWLDLRILIMTVFHVAFGKVEWGDATNRRIIERERTDALGRDTEPQRPAPAGPMPGEPEAPSAPTA